MGGRDTDLGQVGLLWQLEGLRLFTEREREESQPFRLMGKKTVKKIPNFGISKIRDCERGDC